MIGEHVRCNHGGIIPGKQVIPATQADINQLLHLATQRSSLWKEFGINAPPLVQHENLLSWPSGVPLHQHPPHCEDCKQSRKRKAEEEHQSWCIRKRFKFLQEQTLPVSRARRGPVAHLLEGEYALISQEWRLKWLRHLDGCDERPPPLNPKALICEHDKMRYNAAQYFEANKEGVQTPDAIRHPHTSAYTLVPMREAKDLIKEYNCSEPLLVEEESQGDKNSQTIESSQTASQTWCRLVCTSIELGDGVVRTYENLPPSCEICSKVEPLTTCQLQVRDARGGETMGRLCLYESEVRLNWRGTELKNHVAQHVEVVQSFPGVSAGQLLLFLDVHGARSEPVGDADCLEEMLSRQQILPGSVGLALTVEIYAFDLGKPAEKKARVQGGSSLQRSIFVSEAGRNQSRQASQPAEAPALHTGAVGSE